VRFDLRTYTPAARALGDGEAGFGTDGHVISSTQRRKSNWLAGRLNRAPADGAKLPFVAKEEDSEKVQAPEQEVDARRRSPAEAVEAAQVHVPTRGNRKLEQFIEAVNADEQIRARWYMAQITSERLGMSDHSWVHVQVVLNVALRLLRLLAKADIEPAMVADHGMDQRDAEVVVAAGTLLHDIGMSIHRTDHEAYSLFLAADKLPALLEGIYEEPERTVVASEILHAIIGHRRRGEPYTLEAGVVRVADALDMAQGRSRLPIEGGEYGIHALSAAAIDEIRIEAGEERAIKIEIEMNNSAGVFQVDDLLATKIRGTPLEGQVEVVANVPGETEKRLLPEFRIE
jgi:uncharacterized protein